MGGTAERKSIVIGLVCAAVALVIIGFSYVSQRGPRRGDVPSPATGSGTSAVTASSTGNQTTTPKPEEKTASTAAGESKSGDKDAAKTGDASKKTDDPFDYGRMPTVKPDANEDVKSVVEALKNKSNPERLTPLIQPKAFNSKEYRANPAKYRQTIEPGRVYQSAQPAKDVPRIRLASPAMVTIAQGEKTVLKVISAPSWPITLVSFSGGQFPNQLNCITVEANPQGVAEVEYLATPGVIGEVNILAASPMASGQARWLVEVKRPEDGG